VALVCQNLRLEIIGLLCREVEPVHRSEGRIYFTSGVLPNPWPEMKTLVRSRSEGILSIATKKLPISFHTRLSRLHLSCCNGYAPTYPLPSRSPLMHQRGWIYSLNDQKRFARQGALKHPIDQN